MARVEGEFQSDVIRAFKGILDFYYWRGIPVVRSWPRKPVLPRNPAVQSAGQDWRDNSKALSSLPLSLQTATADEVKDTSYTWKDAWTSAVYGHGVSWGRAADQPPQFPENQYAMKVDLFANLAATLVNIPVNSTGNVFRAGWTFWVPFSVVPFSHYRIAGYGQSTQAGQTITLTLSQDQAPFAFAHAPGNDVVIPNAVNHFNTGYLSIDNIPAADERWILLVKGSNVTVDFNVERLYIDFVRL